MLLVFFLSFTFAAASVLNSSSKCTRILENTIARTKTCAFFYLQSLELKFRERGQLIFGPNDQTQAYIYTFASAYNVSVSLADALGNVEEYSPNGTLTKGNTAQHVTNAQAYLNFPGFVTEPTNGNFYYTFQEFSPDARYYQVTFGMPLTQDPITCAC